MGILNITDDSFSGDGLLNLNSNTTNVVERARELALVFEKSGADIIDVGGNSSRPPSVYGDVKPVSEEEELARVIPVIRALSKCVKVPISVDTARAIVASQAVKQGATIINDVSMLADDKMLSVAQETKSKLVITHNGKLPTGKDLLQNVIEHIKQATESAVSAGIERQNIIIDPGIGFNKNASQNMTIIKHLAQFKSELNYPVLVGVSRKNFTALGRNLPLEKRLESTSAASVLAVANGADIVRTHDVAQIKLAVEMTDLITRS